MEGKIVIGGLALSLMSFSLAAAVYQGDISPTWLAVAVFGALMFGLGRASAG